MVQDFTWKSNPHWWTIVLILFIIITKIVSEFISFEARQSLSNSLFAFKEITLNKMVFDLTNPFLNTLSDGTIHFAQGHLRIKQTVHASPLSHVHADCKRSEKFFRGQKAWNNESEKWCFVSLGMQCCRLLNASQVLKWIQQKFNISTFGMS